MDYVKKLAEFNSQQLWKDVTREVYGMALRYSYYVVDYGAGTAGAPLLLGGYSRFKLYEPQEAVATVAEARTNQKVHRTTNSLLWDMGGTKAIVLNTVIAHMEDHQELFKFLRCCEKKTRVYVITPNSTFYRLRRWKMTKEQYASDPTVLHDFDTGKLKRLFEQNDVKTVDIFYRGDKAYPYLTNSTRSRLIGVFETK